MRVWVAFSHIPEGFAIPFTVDAKIELIDGIPEQFKLESLEFKDRLIPVTLDGPQIVEVMAAISDRLKVGAYLTIPHHAKI